MLLRIQPYGVTLKYKPGREMIYADYLSRTKPTAGPEVELEQTIHMVQISTGQLQKVRTASQNDVELSVLRDQILKGWPSQAKAVPKSACPYWSMRDYLFVEDGLVYAGHRLVIPENFRQEYLDRIHQSHQGVTKSQLRAKDSIYWPNLMADIEEKVNTCQVCMQNAKSQRKEPPSRQVM